MHLSLVGTVHGEVGLASIEQLHAILERSQPEVIFAEIPTSHIVSYRDGSHRTLESVAVARYLVSHHIDLVPVDLDKPEQKFFNDTNDMFRAVSRTSSDFRCLMDRDDNEIRENGFHYLNSDTCIQMWADIYHEALATIEHTGSHRLRDIYDLWIKTNERREREWIKNISHYLDRNTLARGMFLVGTAHRESLIDMALEGGGMGLNRIEWDLDSFLK